MAFEVGSIIARFKADTTDFQNGMKEVGGASSSLGNVMGKLGGIIAGVFAVTKIIDFGKEIVTAAAGAQVEMGKFNTIMNNSIGATDAVKQAILDAANATIQLGFDNEETALSIARFYQRTGDLTESLKLNQLAMDLSRDKSMDLKTAQKMVGLVLSGNGKALKQYGIDLKESATPQEALIELQEKLKGSAKAFSETYSGQAEILHQKWKNFQELLGEKLFLVLIKIIKGLGNLITQVQSLIENGNSASGVFTRVRQVWTDLITFIKPLMDWFVAKIIPQLQSIWNELMYFINAVVPPVIAIIRFLIYGIIIPIVNELVALWKADWDHISLILNGAWELIKGIIGLAVNIVMGIITVALDLLTGKWGKAWEDVQHYAGNAWENIKGIFNGIIDFLKGWGGWLWEQLTAPFRRAWEEIEKLVNKIKGALDFTQRHSPSIIDIVENSVDQVNRALNGLKVNVPVNTKAFAGIGITGGGINNVTVDMSGAYITNLQQATDIGEKIGDSIIRKLQKNIRF